MTKNSTGGVNTTKMRSSIDFDERRAKGLCFWCDDKYEYGHKCRKNQLYLIEVNEGSEEEKELEGGGENDSGEEEEDINPQISVHAISGMGTVGYKTMRVTVFIRKRPLHILIDSGSTHNFLDVNVAKKLGCKLEEIGPMKVDVANGSSLSCVAACKGLTWTL